MRILEVIVRIGCMQDSEVTGQRPVVHRTTSFAEGILKTELKMVILRIKLQRAIVKSTSNVLQSLGVEGTICEKISC